jgi:hypothetical protein
MKRATFAVLALALTASTSGCCCFEKMFCWGCGGGCSYGHEGPCCDGCGGGGCSDCGMAGGTVASPDQAAMAAGGHRRGPGSYAVPAKRHPAQGHPLVHQRRNAGGEYEFAAGPPSAGVTYPYYTTRGPRDYLARNPRSIGP